MGTPWFGRRTTTAASGAAAGCLFALASTVVTGVLLFLNGALVLALLESWAPALPSWTRKPEFMQFALFVGPVVLVVLQWMMIDYLRRHLRWSR